MTEMLGPNLDSSKDVVRCSTPASLEKTQGSERINECQLFRVITICYRFQAFIDGGFGGANSRWQPSCIWL